MLAEKLPSQSRNADIGSLTALVTAFDEASFIGLLPHRQTGARRSPGFDHFRVRPPARTDPFQQVEDQCVDGGVHGSLLSSRDIEKSSALVVL